MSDHENCRCVVVEKDLPLAARLREEEGLPLPQMIAQKRAAVIAEGERFESPLRDLARQLRHVAKEHIAYSQVADFMSHMESHLHALAYAEETNRRDRGAPKS